MPASATWLINLLVSVAAVLAAALPGDANLHLAACGAICLVFVVVALRENWRLHAEGAFRPVIGSATARHTGLVWAWGGLAILLTSNLIIDKPWPEWWQFFLGFALAAAGSMWFADTLARDAAKGKIDEPMEKIGRTLVIVQVIGVTAALISMFVDGKFPRATSYADWAGINVFFFGGLAIIVICLNALRTSR